MEMIVMLLAIGVIGLLVLFFPGSRFLALFPSHFDTPFESGGAIQILLNPAVVLILAAVLLAPSLRWLVAWRYGRQMGREGSGEQPRLTVWVLGSLLLGVLLLAKSLQGIYWLMVWDTTYDPLGFLWLIFILPSLLIAGMVLMLLLEHRRKMVGMLYILLVGVLVILVSGLGMRVDSRQLTETHAEQVSLALERYHSRTGIYPASLSELVPQENLVLPEPVMLFGQDWCYEGSEDAYRLGYVDRQHWSDPRLNGRLYKAQGEMPGFQPLCAQEVEHLQARYPGSMIVYGLEGE